MRLVPTSRLVSTLTGLHVQRNKAIVGDNAFAHESGIHQDGMLKERRTYEIMSPADVGLVQTKLVLGKHSGRHAFRNRLEELGLRLDDAALDKAFDQFKVLCDKKKEIYDEDLEALVEQQLEGERQLFNLTNMQVMSGMHGTATAMITLTDSAGTQITDAATGDGPIDAMFAAISRLTKISATLDSYQVRSVTGGKEAQGEVSVELTHSGRRVRGRGFSTDILEASARAYLAAINRIRTMTERKIGQASSLEA
jgi:2-isopropylmalate synthase